MTRGYMMKTILLSIWLGSGVTSSAAVDQGADPAQAAGVALLRLEAKAVEPLVASRLARDFLNATALLPAVAPRTLYTDKTKQAYFTEADVQSLNEQRRADAGPRTG